MGLATSEAVVERAQEEFALLIDKLPADERKALTDASTALKHLLELDEKQRDPAAWQVDERSSGGA